MKNPGGEKIDCILYLWGPSDFDDFTGLYCGAVRISGDNLLNRKHYFSSNISWHSDCGIRVEFAVSDVALFNDAIA